MPGIGVIVEYDGSYYHGGKIRADREQTTALESQAGLYSASENSRFPN
jgi:hypothetical protein